MSRDDPTIPEAPRPSEHKSDFIRSVIAADLTRGKNDGRVVTRFPPEPNGYLHIGHAKSICLNFGIAREFGGVCNLRFDDTNPTTEEREFEDAIRHDVQWLGFDWGDRLFHASRYFEQLYAFAVSLIEKGNAYVCDLSADEIRDYRGNLTEPGRNSPCRERSVEENLDLFARMRAGEFEDGSHVLRARIDMASPNLNLRDPVLYRIRRVAHHRAGDAWCIYPMYDFTHGLSDSIEAVTHSLCTLEFEDHRPLYDWFLDQLDVDCHPQQIEFARLNLSYTVLSKRRLLKLVEGRHVEGWDDPRMPTLSGLRRRGYTASSIRGFCDRIGIAKRDSIVDMAQLEFGIREELDASAPRAMAVLRPLRVVIENYPEDHVEMFEVANHPKNPALGTREVPFSREIFIEREDFALDPPKKFFRLAPGREVRLRAAYLVTCTDVVRDPASGEVTELRCTYDPDTRGGSPPDGRKVKGTLHWVSAEHAVSATVRLYDRLFLEENPGNVPDGGTFIDGLNPASLEILSGCRVEPDLGPSVPGCRFQFERQGYFCVDSDSIPAAPVFNRTVTLRDSWARIASGSPGGGGLAQKSRS